MKERKATATPPHFRRSNQLTPQDYFAWENANAVRLARDDEQNQSAVQDAVIRQIIVMREAGMTLNDAGAILALRFCGRRDGIYFSPSSVRDALHAIGWQPAKQKHAKGGER